MHHHCSPVAQSAADLKVKLARLMAVAREHDLQAWALEDSLYALDELLHRVNELSTDLNLKEGIHA